MSVETYDGDHARQEIDQFSGYTTAPEQGAWLFAHGMLRDPYADYQLVTERPWERPGSEAYVMQFAITGPDGLASHFIAKACIKIPVTPSLGDWLMRREVLAQRGVVVPRLHAVNRGVLIEEYIPYDFRSAYHMADDRNRGQLAEAFIDTYRRVYETGFRPTSLHDVRSHGSDVVMVDFGSDLGGIHASSPQMGSASIVEAARMQLGRCM